MGSINLAYVVPKLSKVWYIDFTKYFEMKQTVTFDRLVKWEWKFAGIHFFMKAFYGSLNLVDSIFSSKVIILLNNDKNCEDI